MVRSGALPLLVATGAMLAGCAGERGIVMDSPSCVQCRITVDTIAVLDFSSSPSLPLRGGTRADILPDGRVVVGPLPGGYELAVFKSDGTFSGLFGEEGSGPQEFKGINGFAVVGDSLWIQDDRNRRCVVVDSHEWVPRRLFDCGPYGMAHTAVRSGMLLTGPSWSRTDMTTAYYARLVTPEGITPLVPTDRIYAMNEPLPAPRVTQRPLTWHTDSTFWIAVFGEYALELWSIGNERLRTLRRSPQWFEPLTDPLIGSPPPGFVPQPSIVAIHESDGVIWVSAITFRSWPTRDMLEGKAARTAFVAILEAVAVNGDLLATTIVDGPPMRFMNNGYAYQSSEDATGMPQYVVSRLALVRP